MTGDNQVSGKFKSIHIQLIELNHQESKQAFQYFPYLFFMPFSPSPICFSLVSPFANKQKLNSDNNNFRIIFSLLSPFLCQLLCRLSLLPKFVSPSVPFRSIQCRNCVVPRGHKYVLLVVHTYSNKAC